MMRVKRKGSKRTDHAGQFAQGTPRRSCAASSSMPEKATKTLSIPHPASKSSAAASSRISAAAITSGRASLAGTFRRCRSHSKSENPDTHSRVRRPPAKSSSPARNTPGCDARCHRSHASARPGCNPPAAPRAGKCFTATARRKTSSQLRTRAASAACEPASIRGVVSFARRVREKKTTKLLHASAKGALLRLPISRWSG